MPKKIRVKRYTKPAMFLHWAAALGIFGLFVHGFVMVRMPVDERVAALALHRSLGVTVLVLVLVRIAWRLTHRPPPPPPMPEWQERVANAMHLGLYGLIVINGISGALGWMFSGDPIVFFGIALPSPVAPNPRLDGISHVVGFLTSRLLAAAIALHVLAALKHHFVDRDRLIARMWLSFTRLELPMRLPVVLTRDEVARLFAVLPPSHRLLAKLLYGTGLRIKEAVRLRVQDVDFARHEIRVRGLAGAADRTTMLPVSLRAELLAHVKAVRTMHACEVVEGAASRASRGAITRGVAGPYVFPFASPANPREPVCRHHMSDAELRRILKHALRETCIGKRATPHSLRHSFATHLLESGQDLSTVQELMGHPDVNATKVYMQLVAPGRGVVSPLDRLAVMRGAAA